MSDRALLEDLLAKLREMEEQLSMADLEAPDQSLLHGRIRHLYILATYVRIKLEGIAGSGSLPPKADPDTAGAPDLEAKRVIPTSPT